MSSRSVGFSGIVLFFAVLLLAPLLTQGQPAKDFVLEDINPISLSYGEQVTLSHHEGAILVLFFFTPQQDQAQQREILTSLTNGLWATYENAGCFRFFAIGGLARESQEEILSMRPNLPNATFPILYDPDKQAWGASTGDLYRMLEDSNVPLAVVIDHDFNIYNWKATVADYQNYNQWLVTWVLELDPYDDEGPEITNFSPPDTSTDVALCTAIEFDILDQCGVEINTLDITPVNSPTVSFKAEKIQGGYHITFGPPSGQIGTFGCWEGRPPSEAYIYSITCSDYAGNQGSNSYLFSTPEFTTGPIIDNMIPGEATNVDPNIVISFDAYEDVTCINRDTIGFQVNGRDVMPWAEVTPLDDHEGYHVSYQPPTPFTDGDEVPVRMDIKTLCGSPMLTSEQYTFTVGEGGPSFTNKEPRDGATDVPPGLNTISVDVTDALYGVDRSSIQLSINGESKLVSTSVIDNGYHVSFDHGLADSQTYTVRGKAWNLAGMPGEDSWSFTTVDNTPPVLTSRRPANNAYNVSVDTDIFFKVADTGVGVSPDSIRLWVNNVEVSLDPNFSKEQETAGSDAVYNCTFVPASPFTEGQVVTLQVQAADKNGNIMAPVTWSFTCSAVPAVAMAGWGNTGIYVSDIGEFEAWALVEYGEGMDMIRNVQMYVMNAATKRHHPVGIFLDLIGYFEGHGVFYYHEYMARAGLVGMLPIYEIAAEDIYGSFSSLWPYLTIVDGSRRKSPPMLDQGFDPTDVPWRIQALMDKYGPTPPDDPSGVFRASLAGGSAPQGSTPIPLVNAQPVIFVGGFYPPAVDISQTSDVLLKALVVDPNGPEDIERVEIYVDGMPTGIMMLDDGSQTDDEPGDGFYVRSFTLEANSRPPGLVMLQIIAFDYAGNVSNVYPYITVEP